VGRESSLQWKSCHIYVNHLNQAQATLKLDGADAALPLFASLAEELGYTQYGQRAANLLEKRQKKSGDKAGRRI
jgi:hypothetical protein